MIEVCGCMSHYCWGDDCENEACWSSTISCPMSEDNDDEEYAR